MTDPKAGKPIPELEGKHYDIGVFGMWFGENYGSVLTYYALRKALMDRGYSVLMLEKPMLGGDVDTEFNPEIHPRVFAREEGYEISPVVKPSEYVSFNRYCDTFIVGSDQVWNFKIARYFRFLSYLSFVRGGNKRISYASSYGHGSSLTPMESLSQVAKYINDFDAVSVREANGVTITQDEFGVKATQVVDPIYLHDRSTFEAIMRPPAKENLPDEGYFLCYVLDPNPEIGKLIKEAAEQRELRPVVMLDGRGDLDNAKKQLGVQEAFRCPDARQWLYYISHADYMITDSFHGACFSLLFHTPVAILANGRGMARIESLVSTYNIPFVFAHDVNELKAVLQDAREIDFASFDAILEIERARSAKWLENALRLEPRDRRTVGCVTHKECCGCGACYSKCPAAAITMEPDAEGFLYPSIDADACTYCGACKKVCPSLNPKLEKKAKPLCFAAYTNDPVREKSSSGGLFSLVAKQILDQGGRVCGAAFDKDFTLQHAWAATEEELEPLRMSKYMQSFTGESYKEAKAFLDDGIPVLYVGCPCQVAGLNSFLGKPYENLTTIDLLCHGGPSQKVFKRYLEEAHAGHDITYVGFRDKDYYGWSTEMTVKYADGDVYREVRSKDIYYRAFLPCLSARPHCQICNYSRLPRQGDLTLGDFWGVSKLNESYTDGRGTSIVSVNSKHGFDILNSLWDSLDLLETVTREYILTHGQPYARPFKNNPLRSRFFRMLPDTSLETAVECGTCNTFDFGLLDVQGTTPSRILRAYALQKTLARANHSVLVVRRPAELQEQGAVSPFRFDEFARDNLPAVSAHKTANAQQEMQYLCRGFVTDSGGLDIPETTTGKKSVVVYDESVNGEWVNPLLLMTREDLEALFDEKPVCSTHTVAISAPAHGQTKSKAIELCEAAGCTCIDLDKDMPVAEWLKGICGATLVITDNSDAACAATVFCVPVAAWGSDDGRLSMELKSYGIESPTFNSAEGLLSLLGTHETPAIDRKLFGSRIETARTAFVAAAESAMGELVARPKPEPEQRPKEKKKARGIPALANKGIKSIKKNGVAATAKKTLRYLKRKHR